ncbi:hypothetical protein GCM10023144_43850 [Pigmentiphaga soli]|uniref:histidine kinase n=1 Tax=Pigmentiphaga soli TaxID=1007095 RepID=A0ABP8HPD0_9BURK
MSATESASAGVAAASGRRAGSLGRDLIWLGVLPCALAAVALTAWFTRTQLDTLETAFRTEGHAVARQVAIAGGLPLYAGDLPTLRHIAESTVAAHVASRVEIGNAGELQVDAGVPAAELRQARAFFAPVAVRSGDWPSDFARAPGAEPQYRTIGSVRVFLDASALRRERTISLTAGAGIALLALALAWLSGRHVARAVLRPLRRISSTVAALHGGRLDARCGPCGRHEIASLASDIDRLAERLQTDVQQRERRIREATAEAVARTYQAEQATLARTRFLAAASHDLRQPLHAMGLFIDSLLPGATPDQQPALERLHESTQVMSTLLDDLLDISRLDARVLKPSLAPVALSTLFGQLDTVHGAHARERGVRLLWRDRRQAVVTDPALTLRVIGNLVHNAVRNAEGGTVLVTARRTAGGRVRIEVRDNGTGIARVHQARIFDEFYQVGNPGRDRRKGFGLGLSICSRIAQLLDTEIRLRSEPGRGSTFSFELPQTDLSATPVNAGETPPPIKPLCCLVVDDNEAILDGTASLLGNWGCKVDRAASAEIAVDQLDRNGAAYDIVLCDLQLRDAEDGLAVIAQARRLAPQALAVLVSGATTPDTLRRLQRDGIPLLTKPVAPARLRALLATRRAG